MPLCFIGCVEGWATNSTAIEANQTLLRILCYMPAGGNEAIQGLYKMLAGLLLASGQQYVSSAWNTPNHVAVRGDLRHVLFSAR